jgi:hypothetical protein
MDLLEMKFFLNGVDLGTAFVNFSCNGLYPALSLNVRQCLRVNYGQERFIYPPTVVDGLPFRSVLEANKLNHGNKEIGEKKKMIPSAATSTAATATGGATIGTTSHGLGISDLRGSSRVVLQQSEESKSDHVTTAQATNLPPPSSSATTSASHIFPTEVIPSSLDQPHGGGGSRVGGVRLGRTGEIPHDEDRNPIERIITVDSTTEDETSAAATAASRRVAGGEEGGEGNEVCC